MGKVVGLDGTPAAPNGPVMLSPMNDSQMVAYLAIHLMATDDIRLAAMQADPDGRSQVLGIYVDYATELLCAAHLRRNATWGTLQDRVLEQMCKDGLAQRGPGAN